MADIRCPICGELNPENSQTCRTCKAILNPPADGQPGEQPASQSNPPPAKFELTQPPAEDETDWLEQLRDLSAGMEESAPITPIDPSNPESPNHAAAGGQKPDRSLADDETIPSWLAGIIIPDSGQSKAEQAEIPDWIARLKPENNDLSPTAPEEKVNWQSEEDGAKKSGGQTAVESGREWEQEYPRASVEADQPGVSIPAEPQEIHGLDAGLNFPPVEAESLYSGWMSAEPDAGEGGKAGLPDEDYSTKMSGWMENFPLAGVSVGDETAGKGLQGITGEDTGQPEIPVAPPSDQSVPGAEIQALLRAGEEGLAPWEAESPKPEDLSFLADIPASADWQTGAIPDWQGAGGEPQPSAPAEPVSTDLPDWIKTLQAQTPVTESVEQPAAAETSAAFEQVEPEGSQPKTILAGQENFPEDEAAQRLQWLREPEGTGQPADAEGTTPQPSDWLNLPESTPAPADMGGDLDWLRVVGEAPAASAESESSEDWLAPPPPSQPTQSFDEVTDWARMSIQPEAETTQPGEDLPDWLKAAVTPVSEDTSGLDFSQMTASIPEDAAAAPEMVEAESSEPVARQFAPETEMMEFSGIHEDAVEAQPAGEAIEKGDLPEWVQSLQPIETAVPETIQRPDDDQLLEKTGPLAGLVGVLQPEALTARYRKPPVYTSRLNVNEKQKQLITMLDEMINSEPQAADVRKTRHTPPRQLPKIVLGFILLAAVLLTLLGGWQGTGPVFFAPEVKGFFAEVERMPANAPVLLAVDTEPGLSGEMRISMGGIVEHLMAKNARLALVSTVPAGPALAEELLAAAQKKQPGYPLNTQTVNLGYLPGGTSSLLELALNPRKAAPISINSFQVLDAPWDSTVLKGIVKISQFAMVIVFTDNSETARAWVEQVQPALDGKPLLMGVSAQTAPVVRPYTTGGQIRGLVSGFWGGRMYDALRGQGSRGGTYGGAYQAAMIFAALIAAIGLLLGILSILFPRRKA